MHLQIRPPARTPDTQFHHGTTKDTVVVDFRALKVLGRIPKASHTRGYRQHDESSDSAVGLLHAWRPGLTMRVFNVRIEEPRLPAGLFVIRILHLTEWQLLDGSSPFSLDWERGRNCFPSRQPRGNAFDHLALG